MTSLPSHHQMTSLPSHHQMTSLPDHHQMTSLPSHHERQELCFTRAPYRAPNKPNAVKVYTVSQESCYLLVQNVPALNLSSQLAKLLHNSGTLVMFEKLDKFPGQEAYTDCYLVKYTTLSTARFVKKKFDDHTFYASQLHISYAPEHETVSDTLIKLHAFRTMGVKMKQTPGVKFGKCREPRPAQTSISGTDCRAVYPDTKHRPACTAAASSSAVHPVVTVPRPERMPGIKVPTVPYFPPNPKSRSLHHPTTFLPRQVQIKQPYKPENLLISKELLYAPKQTPYSGSGGTLRNTLASKITGEINKQTDKAPVVKKRRRI